MTPKEKIIQLIKHNGTPGNYPTTYLLTGEDIKTAAKEIIFYFHEATGYDLEKLLDKEEEIN